MGTVGFDLWYLRQLGIVNMAGSLDQATIVYNYFQDYCDIHPTVVSSIVHGERGIKLGATESVDGHIFRCLPASPKSVRGKHEPVLLMDEVCEILDTLVDAAIPIVNHHPNGTVVMASTFHKIYGRFAEIWDNAEEKGYLRISWDIFDVVQSFSPDVWDQYQHIEGIEQLKAYAKGRTGDPEGWFTIENIIQMWREKPTVDWFEVECMGSRPSAAGLVLHPEDVEAARYDEAKESRYNYIQGATCVLGIDWGFSTMTSVVEIMGLADSHVALIDNKNYHQIKAEDIIKDVVAKVKAHGIRFIYADSAGKFENVALQSALVKAELPCAVIEVVFSKEKFGNNTEEFSISMLGNLRAHFERRLFHFSKRFVDVFYQLKSYRYDEKTDKPVKKDDHIPDAIMCALQHFKLGFTPQAPYVQPEKQKPKMGEEPTTEPLSTGLLDQIF